MDDILIQKILSSLAKGDTATTLTNIVIFGLIWLDVKGMKTELKNIGDTVKTSFADGEKRFEQIESVASSFQNRITTLEVNFIRMDQDLKKITNKNKEQKNESI